MIGYKKAADRVCRLNRPASQRLSGATDGVRPVATHTPEPEWVDLNTAVVRLAMHWNIPQLNAEQIIYGVLQGGEARVRGRAFSDFAVRIISKEIGATLSPSRLSSQEFYYVEIEWNDLLLNGRNLIPAYLRVRKALNRGEAIAELLESGERPGTTISWAAFCDAVRDNAEGWVDKRNGKSKRGFGNKSIERCLRQQMDKTDK
jgi:hypothetical protein